MPSDHKCSSGFSSADHSKYPAWRSKIRFVVNVAPATTFLATLEYSSDNNNIHPSSKIEMSTVISAGMILLKRRA